jgi:hypothetical protein
MSRTYTHHDDEQRRRWTTARRISQAAMAARDYDERVAAIARDLRAEIVR